MKRNNEWLKKTDQQNKEWFENVLYLLPHPHPPANTLIPVVGTKHEMVTRYTYAREEERRKETRELSKKTRELTYSHV